MDVLSSVSTTIARYEMIRPGDRVLIALSGGGDSVCLLHVLFTLQARLACELRAVYIDHHLRPEEVVREIAFCRNLAAKLEIPLDVERIDVPAAVQAVGGSIETVARRLRHDRLDRLAEQFACRRIATGHHRDDNIETVFFRIVRGTGLAGLTGIPPVRDKYIRPLIAVDRASILAYLKRHRLRFRHDSSNDDLHHRRNLIRQRILPLIRQELHPGVDEAIAGLSETAAEENAELQRRADAAARRVRAVSIGGKIELDLARLGKYDGWVRRRVVRDCLTELHSEQLAPSRATTADMLELVSSADTSQSFPGGIQAAARGSRLVIFRGRQAAFGRKLDPGKWTSVGSLAMKCRAGRPVDWTGPLERRRAPKQVVVDAARLEGGLTVRSVRPGDRFRPLGLRGTKKVGDFLTDRRVWPLWRDEIPVVADSKGIVWVVGFEIDDRVRVRETTEKVVHIEIAIAAGRFYEAVRSAP